MSSPVCTRDHVLSDLTIPWGQALIYHVPHTGQAIPKTPSLPPRELSDPPSSLPRSYSSTLGKERKVKGPWSSLDLDEEQASEQGKARKEQNDLEDPLLRGGQLLGQDFQEGDVEKGASCHAFQHRLGQLV